MNNFFSFFIEVFLKGIIQIDPNTVNLITISNMDIDG